MATIELGFGISSIRGKIGGVVASKWKQSAYLRSKVTPANPQSAGQVTQRTAMAICVATWKGFSAATKAVWNTYVTGQNRSGFNGFVSENVAAEAAGNFAKVTPNNPDVSQIATFAAAGGIGSGEIDVTWAQGDAELTDDVVLYARKLEDTEWTTDTSKTVTDLGATLTGLEAGEDYIIYVYTIDGDSGVSSTQTATATATA